MVDQVVLVPALRHLAWVAQDDGVVRRERSSARHDAVWAYGPEPFRTLGQENVVSEQPRGNEREIIGATLAHRRRVHGMEGRRAEVGARAAVVATGHATSGAPGR